MGSLNTVEKVNKDVQNGGYSSAFASTFRRDNWWLEPLTTGLGFLVFIIYSTWAAFQGKHYWYESYLSPFYSPLLFIESSAPGAAPLSHAWFGSWPSWWPKIIPSSPALLILIGPLSFRLTCYYYRKFYYRAYFASPPTCGVTALPQKNYKGEEGLFLFQNIHRYTMYVAIFYIVVLCYDCFSAFFRNGVFGIGVGNIIMLVNVALLSCYTLGCHALRHLIGGSRNCFSCENGGEHLSYKIWKPVSWLNSRHMFWAWVSLIWVGFTDFYIRMVSMGIFPDVSTWGPTS